MAMVSTPFPMPPSLDATNDANAQSSTTGVAAPEPNSQDSATGETGSGQLNPSSDHEAVLSELKTMILEDFDEKMSSKMKDLWSKGNKMMKEIETETQQQTTQLLEELSQSREKQEALKAEQDHLRTMLTSMVQHLSMLGAAYGGQSPLITPSTTVPTTPSAVAGNTSSVPTSGASGLQDSPPGLGDPAYIGASLPILPVTPDFPFPAPSVDACTPATPLSLVEALGQEPQASLSDMIGSLSPTTPAEMDTGFVFSFTLRKADGTDLGINVSHHEHDKMLRVEGVRPEGAVEAWNRQCMSSAAAEKAVIPGDRIVSVNGVLNEPAKMLEECREKQLLKFTVMRGGAPLLQVPPSTPAATPSAASTTLRADACEFIPGGLPDVPSGSDGEL